MSGQKNQLYIVDASSWITCYEQHYPTDVFPKLWDLVRAGRGAEPRGEAVLKVLEKTKEPLGKAAMVEKAKLDEADWRPAITELRESGRVTQEGERRVRGMPPHRREVREIRAQDDLRSSGRRR